MDNDPNNTVPAAQSTLPPDFEVLDQMQAMGEKISVRNFRQKLGGGNMDRVSQILRSWRESRLTPPPPMPGNLGAGLAAVSQTLWKQALESARIQAGAELAELRTRVATLEGAVIAAESQAEEARDQTGEARALAVAESTARLAVESHLANRQTELQAERQALSEAQRKIQAAESHIQDLQCQVVEAEGTASQMKMEHLRALHEVETQRSDATAREAEVRADRDRLMAMLNEKSLHLKKTIEMSDHQAMELRELKGDVREAISIATRHLEKQAPLEAELHECRSANRALRDQLTQSQATIDILTTHVLSDLATMGGRMTDLRQALTSAVMGSDQAADERHRTVMGLLAPENPTAPEQDHQPPASHKS